MSTSFAVTWDYRCPFARIGHQHVLAGVRDGAAGDLGLLVGLDLDLVAGLVGHVERAAVDRHHPTLNIAQSQG